MYRQKGVFIAVMSNPVARGVGVLEKKLNSGRIDISRDHLAAVRLHPVRVQVGLPRRAGNTAPQAPQALVRRQPSG